MWIPHCGIRKEFRKNYRDATKKVKEKKKSYREEKKTPLSQPKMQANSSQYYPNIEA